MITAWRLCRSERADLSGRESIAEGGRWTSPGAATVYLSEHPALALLEARVHLTGGPEDAPADMALCQVALPSNPPPDHIPALPGDPRAAGDAWLREGHAPVLRVPSIILPASWNLLLNPAHPSASQARIERMVPIALDPRLWRD
jgi:RES domain-containing protein